MRLLARVFLAVWLGAGALLATSVAAPQAVLAWNYSRQVNAYGACQPSQYCILHFYVDGGPDAWDYVRVDYHYYYAGNRHTQHWEGGMNRGWQAVPFWTPENRWPSHFVIWSYDQTIGDAWCGPYW